MRVYSSTRLAAIAALVGALGCAGNSARDTDEAAAARDTTTSDTLGGTQNPPGYRGMERDTTIAPAAGQQPSDTFQNRGTGQARDTAGYSRMERTDTADAGSGPDTTGTSKTDSAGVNKSGAGVNPSGTDSTGMSKSADTTGYDNAQQSDTTTSR